MFSGECLLEPIITSVDWLAVIVGAVVSFMVGWAWYSPLMFGKKWAEGVGVELGSASEMPVKAMLVQIFATFLLAWAIGVAIMSGNYPLAILITLTVAAFIKSSGLYSKKSYYAIFTEAGFMLVMGAIMILTHIIL